jgi:hypothetical protein
MYLRSLIATLLVLPFLLEGCGSNPCFEPSDAVGERFVSPQDSSLSITWESSSYIAWLDCQREDRFLIQGVDDFEPEQGVQFLQEHVVLPEEIRSTGIGPMGDGIRLDVALDERTGLDSYDVTLDLDGASVTATIPLEN